MKTPKTKQDLENLIRDKIEESSELEYKDARALNEIKEIAKDVSSMANSAGGIIIYGIAEEDHFPKKITPINRDEFSKERLEQIITSNISPKIEQLKIIPVDVGAGAVYVVEISQSTTAHQNTKDQRYYKRRNFKSEPMLDYEIRDVMNRAKYPIVELEFEGVSFLSRIFDEIHGQDIQYDCKELKIRPVNKGQTYAKFVNYFIEFPLGCVDGGLNVGVIRGDILEYYGENVVEPQGRFDPILPGVYGRSESIRLAPFFKLDNREIKWRVHADNAPVQVGSISLNKIPFKKNAN